MNDRKKLRTFLLLERAYIATVEQENKVKVAIDATDKMLKDLKEKHQNCVNVKKSYNITYGCYSDLKNGPLTTIIFLSPIFAEIIKLSENLRGNNFEVVEGVLIPNRRNFRITALICLC